MEKIGRDERIRTSDPHTPSVMRYQAALRPDLRGLAAKGGAGEGRPIGMPLRLGKQHEAPYLQAARRVAYGGLCC